MVINSDGERWERLFADLEGEAESFERDGVSAEVLDRSRAEAGRVALLDRLRAATGSALTVAIRGLGVVNGEVVSAGPGWLLLRSGTEILVAEAAVCSISGLARHAIPPESAGRVAARLDLRHALRRLARERIVVRVFLVDGGSIGGTLDHVGGDHVDLAEHDVGEVRRTGAVRGVRTIPIHALAAIRAQ